MSMHLQREIEAVKLKLLGLCALVEKSLALAIRSVAEQDAAMARTVIDDDAVIDRMEVEIEEDCLKILALYQPVAIDLRTLVAVLKIDNDLERIGDLAVNIAERARYLSTSSQALPAVFDFDTMSATVGRMLKTAVDAFVGWDAAAARRVGESDDTVDAINRAMYTSVQESIRGEDADVKALLHLLTVSRDLERIADHATNIAEDVVYMASGEIIRHHAGNRSRAET